MRSPPPRVFAFARNRGLPNSIVRTSVLGTGLQTVTALRFSGSGVLAVILGSLSADTLDVVISIAADAAPGPRALMLSSAQGGFSASELSGAVFYVLAPSVYASASGIGSHLI
jgi:hypothetical protein